MRFLHIALTAALFIAPSQADPTQTPQEQTQRELRRLQRDMVHAAAHRDVARVKPQKKKGPINAFYIIPSQRERAQNMARLEVQIKRMEARNRELDKQIAQAQKRAAKKTRR